jgi:NCS1 nucleoside transporter family
MAKTESQALTSEAGFELLGTEPVPRAWRKSTPLDQYWIWSGANIAPINWILGALGIILGLSLWEVIAVLAIGNVLGCGLFGLFTLMGHKTGVDQMVLSRAAFGQRGALIPIVFKAVLAVGFVAIDTIAVLTIVDAIFEKLGIGTSQGIRVVVAIGISVIQVVIALYGFRAIRVFEKYTVPITFAVMVAMTAVAWTKGGVDWGHVGSAHGVAKWAAMTQLMTAIGIGWGISWLPFASDYSRFVRESATPKRVFWAGALGQFIPVMWLGILGATIATTGTAADPGVFVVAVFGAAAIFVLFLVLHGPIAANIIDLYSITQCVLAGRVKIRRDVVMLGAGVVTTVLTVILTYTHNFATTLDTYLVALLLWITPWAAIMLVEWLVFSRRQVDVNELMAEPAESLYGDVRWDAVISFGIGVVCTWAFLFGIVGPMQGVAARAMNGIDLSWLVGGIVTASVYYFLRSRSHATARVSTVR